jgi:hypothetical protein
MITLEEIFQIVVYALACGGLISISFVGYMVYSVWRLERESKGD